MAYIDVQYVFKENRKRKIITNTGMILAKKTEDSCIHCHTICFSSVVLLCRTSLTLVDDFICPESSTNKSFAEPCS